MKYYYEKPQETDPKYGIDISLDHPVYKHGTLFKIEGRGLVITQKRFDHKYAYWDSIDPWLANDIYENPRFRSFFDEQASLKPYPILELRHVMWALRMKPLRKEEWEGYF